jgi:hypothetical protein
MRCRLRPVPRSFKALRLIAVWHYGRHKRDGEGVDPRGSDPRSLRGSWHESPFYIHFAGLFGGCRYGFELSRNPGVFARNETVERHSIRFETSDVCVLLSSFGARGPHDKVIGRMPRCAEELRASGST